VTCGKGVLVSPKRPSASCVRAQSPRTLAPAQLVEGGAPWGLSATISRSCLPGSGVAVVYTVDLLPYAGGSFLVSCRELPDVLTLRTERRGGADHGRAGRQRRAPSPVQFARELRGARPLL
jgi:hypothetical protein